MARAFQTVRIRLAVPLWLALLPFVPLGFSEGSEMETKVIEEEWGKPVDGLAISIKTDKHAYAPEERIVLKVCLRNVGQRSVTVLHNVNPLALYELNVSFSDEQPVPPTLYGQGRLDAPCFGTTYAPLKPAEEVGDEISLGRLFDFSLDRTYTVSVTRALWQDERRMLRATSNVLTLTVDDARDPARSVTKYWSVEPPSGPPAKLGAYESRSNLQ